MLICSQCNQRNDDGSPFCTTCGVKLDVLSGQATYIETGNNIPSYAYSPPLQNQPIVPVYNIKPGMPGYRCPFCSSQVPPVIRKSITTAGWIVFAVLIFFCVPLCWIGLLMTEEKMTCGTCGTKLN